MAVQRVMNEACLDATKPPSLPVGERRFAPAETLQTTGELSKQQILAFTTECAKVRLDDASIRRDLPFYLPTISP